MRSQAGRLDRAPRIGRRQFVGQALLGSAAVAAMACGSSASAPAAPAGSGGAPVASLSFGIIAPTALSWIAYVIDQKGLARREGLDAELIVNSTVAAGLQSLAAPGGVRIQSSSTDPAIRAVEQGNDFTFVGSVMENPAYSFVVSPSITTVADLRGKAVAVSGPRDGATTFLRRLLVRNGIDPESVDFLLAGGTPERLAAMKTGAVVGTVLSQPQDFQALADGFRILSRLDVGTYQFLAWTVMQSWARENSDTVVRFLRANRAAAHWLNDPANKEEAIAILVKATQTEERFARQTYELYLEEMRGQVMPTDGSLNLAGIQAAIDLMAELGEFEGRPKPPVEKYVDLSYQQRATSSAS